MNELIQKLMNKMGELEMKIASLESNFKSLEAGSTIPFTVEQAIRDRLRVGSTSMEVSAKVATSESVSINEGGSALKEALANPDAFAELDINGTAYIPIFR